MNYSPHFKWVAGLLLTVLVTGVFLPSRHYEYTRLDDNVYTYNNPHIQKGLCAEGIRWAFSSSEEAYWIPVTRLSYLADTSLFGISPETFRSTNILLHTLNTLLLFYLLYKTTRKLWAAALTAAFFSIHPLRIESVVWITERKDVLCTFWSLLSILFYIRWQSAEKKQPGFFLLSLLCFLTGLAAKPLWIMLPALLLLIDFWPLRRLNVCAAGTSGGSGWQILKETGWRIAEKVPYGLLSIVFAGITLATQSKVIASGEHAAHLPGPAPLMAFNFAFYLKKIFLPSGLALEYASPPSIPDAEWMTAAAGLIACTLLVLILIKKAPYLTFGWFWYLLALLPVSGIIRVGTVTHADRFSYLPSIGIFTALVWAAFHCLEKRARPVRTAAAACAVLLLALLCKQTRAEMTNWATGIGLLERSLQVTGGTPTVHNNLGTALAEKGQYAEAIRHFETVLENYPENSEALYNLGGALTQSGRSDEAVSYYERLLRNIPGHISARCNLAVARGNLGQYGEAVRCYEQVLEREPDNLTALCNLGVALIQAGSPDEAQRRFAEVLRRDSGNLSALYNLGLLYSKQGKNSEASDCFRSVLRRNSAHPSARRQLSEALYRQAVNFQLQKKSGPATVCYKELLALDPRRVDALNNLAWLLATCPDQAERNGPKAVELAKQAVELGNRAPALLDTLAAALAENGQYEEACATLRQAHETDSATMSPAEQAAYQSRLTLYQSGRPYHESP